jgi:hypothetical protein
MGWEEWRENRCLKRGDVQVVIVIIMGCRYRVRQEYSRKEEI